MTSSSKPCTKCGIVKSLSEFTKRVASPDGLSYICKGCAKAYSKLHRVGHLEEASVKSKAYYASNKEHIKAKSRANYHKNRESNLIRMREAHSKRRLSVIEASHSPVTGGLAVTFLSKLTISEMPEVIDGVLHVRCTYCGKLYQPTKVSVSNRIQSIQNGKGGERRLYCSDGCKKACPIYWTNKWPKGHAPATSREVQPQLRKMVLARDNYTCQKCGAGQEKELHCHHTDPVANNPIESADADVCITYCVDCHKEAHQTPGCRLGELKCFNF